MKTQAGQHSVDGQAARVSAFEGIGTSNCFDFTRLGAPWTVIPAVEGNVHVIVVVSRDQAVGGADGRLLQTHLVAFSVSPVLVSSIELMLTALDHLVSLNEHGCVWVLSLFRLH